jgi:hypothetical protein
MGVDKLEVTLIRTQGSEVGAREKSGYEGAFIPMVGSFGGLEGTSQLTLVFVEPWHAMKTPTEENNSQPPKFIRPPCLYVIYAIRFYISRVFASIT